RRRRDAVDEHVRDRRLLRDHLLDEPRAHEVAVAPDADALAPVEEEPAVGVAMPHVAAPEPAAGGLRTRGGRVPEVLHLGRLAGGRPGHDLADDAGRALDVALVDDPHLEPGDRLPEAPRRADAGRPEREPALDRAVPLEDAHAEAALE